MIVARTGAEACALHCQIPRSRLKAKQYNNELLKRQLNLPKTVVGDLLRTLLYFLVSANVYFHGNQLMSVRIATLTVSL